MDKKQTRIGIVGMGRMGSNIALHLNDEGWNLEAIYDRDPAAANVIAEQAGSVICATLADVTELCDVIFTVVSDDAAMRAIFSESGDSLLPKSAGKIFINCATVTPQVHVDVQRLCDKYDARSLEACMAGSIPQARGGTLTLICAGRKAVFDSVNDLLDAVGSTVTYVGEAGKAAQIKALVNMLMNINTAGLAEALALGDALGADLSTLREIFSKTGAASRVLETDGEDMQKRDHEPYFSAAHAAKDSNIALALAHDAKVSVPLAEVTAQQYDKMVALGIGNLDKSGIAELTFKSRAPK